MQQESSKALDCVRASPNRVQLWPSQVWFAGLPAACSGPALHQRLVQSTASEVTPVLLHRASSHLLERLGLLLPFDAAEPLAAPIIDFSDKPWPWIHYHPVGYGIEQHRFITSVGCTGEWLGNNRLVEGEAVQILPFYSNSHIQYVARGACLSILSASLLCDALSAQSPCGLLQSRVQHANHKAMGSSHDLKVCFLVSWSYLRRCVGIGIFG